MLKALPPETDIRVIFAASAPDDVTTDTGIDASYLGVINGENHLVRTTVDGVSRHLVLRDEALAGWLLRADQPIPTVDPTGPIVADEIGSTKFLPTDLLDPEPEGE